MRAKKRKTNDSVSKGMMTRKKMKKEGELEQVEDKTLSLPALSEEKNCYDDQMKTRMSIKMDEKNPKIVLPKVKITCVPLNVEKIIDFGCNSVILNKDEVTKSNKEKKPKKASQAKSRKQKKTNNDDCSHTETATPKIIKTRKQVKKIKESNCTDTLTLTNLEKKMNGDSNTKISTETLGNDSELNCKKLSMCNLSCAQESVLKSQSSQKSPVQNCEKHPVNPVNGLENEALLPQESSDYLSFCGLDDEYAFMELNDVNLEELTPTLDVFDEPFNVKINENDVDANGAVTSSNVSLNTSYFRCKDHNELGVVKNDLSNQGVTLQAAVENFMSNTQTKYLKEISALKKGLCLTWLTNNYVCANQQCLYSHCAVKLFTKKMKYYPSKFILNLVVSMTDDILFVDVIMAAFKILSARKVPVVWVTFLIYFVFYATEPSDSRFLKFWANAARFYCQLSNEYIAANGFTSLLSVFSKGEKSEEWKIIEFIKLIKQPPIQVSINYELLQPVLKLNLPSQFLTEAVESCIATQKDVLNVYLWVIPKISFMTSPIQTVELLLKFSKILEGMDLDVHAENLKRKLRTKVKSFKTKITQYDYPFTAAFQEEIILDPIENDCLNSSENIAESKKSKNMPLEAVNRESNYFQIENNFYSLMVETLDLTCVAVPGKVNIQSLQNSKTHESQDICERQIKRVQQFFCDCQFDLLGKYLNDLKPNILERAAEEFLRFLFQMKISLQQGVDLIKIILLQCKTDSAVKIIASVCITFILNLVRVNEWEKAYTIVSLCEEKRVNLIEGKVFYSNELCTISQCRIALLLVEINSYNANYQRAMKLIKDHSLFSFKSSLWKLHWTQEDERIRIRIMEDFLQQVISKQLTEIVTELFVRIWREQKQLNSAVDLRKFVDEVIIMLLNKANEEAITVYEKARTEVQLSDITVRAILVTLVRLNRFSAAKSLLTSTAQNVYSFPQVISGPFTIMISSIWLEEEIYIIFDGFLELLAAKRRALISNEFENLEINIQILKPNLISTPKIIPLCLGIINPSFKDTCNRIQRVLYQFRPPLKLIVMPYHLKLDEYSLQVNLYNRVHQSLKDQPKN